MIADFQQFSSPLFAWVFPWLASPSLRYSDFALAVFPTTLPPRTFRMSDAKRSKCNGISLEASIASRSGIGAFPISAVNRMPYRLASTKLACHAVQD